MVYNLDRFARDVSALLDALRAYARSGVEFPDLASNGLRLPLSRLVTNNSVTDSLVARWPHELCSRR